MDVMGRHRCSETNVFLASPSAILPGPHANEMKKSLLARARGFTLIELIIGLAVIGIALGVIMGVAGSTQDNSKSQNEIKNLAAIGACTKSTVGATNTYTGITNAILLNSNCFPAQMLVGGAPVNSWGGAITVTADAIGTAGYDISSAGLPQQICIQLTTSVLNNYANIKVNSTSKPGGATGGWTVATLNTACAAGSTNTVIFNGI